MKVCLFDIDGTLVNTHRAGKDAMIQAFLEVAELTELEHVLQVSGKTDRGIFAELFELHGKVTGDEAWSKFLELYLTGLSRNLPERQGIILEGVTALLAKLSQRDDVLLGLLTGNVRRGADIKLEHYGIRQYFHFGGFGDDHPDRNDVARMALEEAKQKYDGDLSPDDVYVIGDTPNDIRCARAIGAKAVAVATGVYPEEQLREAKPDLLLPDLTNMHGVMHFIFDEPAP